MGEGALGSLLSVAVMFGDGPHTFLTQGPWGHPSFLFMSFHTATLLCYTTSASIPQGRRGTEPLRSVHAPVGVHKLLQRPTDIPSATSRGEDWTWERHGATPRASIKASGQGLPVGNVEMKSLHNCTLDLHSLPLGRDKLQYALITGIPAQRKRNPGKH